jgi:type II secretory pathway component PulK
VQPRFRSARGAALLAAVAGTAVVATIAAGVGRWALADARQALRTADGLQADALVRSGVTTAAVLLEERAAGREPDLLGPPLAPHEVRFALGGGTVVVAIEDAGRRIDLGAPALAGTLARLMANLGLPPALADTLGDWIDPDDQPRPQGAERDWYLGRRPPLVPANAPLSAVSHLGLVRGFDPAAETLLAPYVAVAGERTLNPNTAPPAVLAAWLGDDAAESVLARRARAPVACTGLPVCATRSVLYLVRVTARVHGVTRAAEATLFVPPAGRADVRAFRRLGPQERGQAEGVA